MSFSLNSLFSNQVPKTAKFVHLNLDYWARMEFAENRPVNRLLDPVDCGNWVKSLHKFFDVDFSYGGYLEDRSFLWKGSYLERDKSIHLGIDINVRAGVFVVIPTSFIVRNILFDKDSEGGWGGRVVIEINGQLVVFAHLNIDSALGTDKMYVPGTTIGRVAPHQSNGGWYPHLHIQGIQCITQIHEPGFDGYGRASFDNYYRYPHPFIALNISTHEDTNRQI